jgi:hypothetical protein
MAPRVLHGGTPVLRARLGGMTTREKAHKLLDELPESEVEPIVEIMASRGKGKRSKTARRGAGENRIPPEPEPEMVGVPESWKTLPSGAPAPNWVAGLDEVRRGR